MPKQHTDTIFMVRPVNFKFNEQTAANNYYQQNINGYSADKLNEQAIKEFDCFVEILKEAKINVVVIDDTLEPSTPDSIFPNNWISFHESGVIGLYPMFAPNRRLERREDILDKLAQQFVISERIDLTYFEQNSQFLEGTGSIVLDRQNKLAYAAISERTNEFVLDEFCKKFKYKKVVFHALQTVNNQRMPIYHTNVMMCVASNFVVVCLDTIDNEQERDLLIRVIEESGKQILAISEDQVNQFAGNMLEVESMNGDQNLIMSTSAFRSLNEDQIKQIRKYCKILHSPLDTVETLGGGSARCMMAEVFLPKQ